MAFDSVTKDFAKKKKASRSAKLKQCKLDARRHQWLSQVKNKENKDGLKVVGGEIRVCPTHGRNERDRAIKLLEVNPGNDENDGSVNHYSDSDSSSHSPTSQSSSVVESNCSGTSFTGSGSSSRSSNSSSSGRSHSGNISEEEEEEEEEEEDDDDDDDGCLSDWEAVADALAASDDKQQQEQHKPSQETSLEHENITKLNCPSELTNMQALVVDISKSNAEISRAWRPDDTFRPQSLPNLVKQHSFPMKLDRRGGPGSVAWACTNGISTPSSCPICCEDLDFTDSSFLPCSCGFRLCLFCHKRILEEDGRCPGCRKQYEHDGVRGEENGFVEGGSSFHLTRSYSMITRS